MPYRDIASMEVPDTVEIPTCDRCGSEWIDSKTAKILNEALEAAYQLLLLSPS